MDFFFYKLRALVFLIIPETVKTLVGVHGELGALPLPISHFIYFVLVLL